VNHVNHAHKYVRALFAAITLSPHPYISHPVLIPEGDKSKCINTTTTGERPERDLGEIRESRERVWGEWRESAERLEREMRHTCMHYTLIAIAFTISAHHGLHYDCITQSHIDHEE